MEITATQFKVNFGKYLEMSKEEDIFITKNGKTIAKLVNPNVSNVRSLKGALVGKARKDITIESEKEERLLEYEMSY